MLINKWIKFKFHYSLIRLLFISLFFLVPLYFDLSFTTYALPKIAMTQIFVLLMMGLWFFKMVLSGEISIKKTYLLIPILIYLSISLASLTWSISIPGALSLMGRVFSYIFLSLIIINHFSEREIKPWVFALTLSGFLISLYGILQYFGMEPFLKEYDYIPRTPFSTLGHKNQVAQFLILVIPLSALFSLFSKQWPLRFFFLLSSLSMVYELTLTQSRGGILGFILSFLIISSLLVYKVLKKEIPGSIKFWVIFLILFFGGWIASFFLSSSFTIHTKDIQRGSFLLHTLDSSKIREKSFISISLEYRILEGTSDPVGLFDLYRKGFQSKPLFLKNDGKEWRSLREEIPLPISPDQDLFLRWIPFNGTTTVQFRRISVETNGVNLIKHKWLNNFFLRLGIPGVDKALSIEARIYMYSNTLRMILDHLILGVGFGNFKYVYPRYRDLKEWTISGFETRVEEAHNEYLQVFSEVGFLGFFAFMFIIFRILKMSWELFLKESFNQTLLLSIALSIGILSTLIQCLFDSNLQNPASGITFWSSVGFLEILYQREKPSRMVQLINFEGRPFFKYLFALGILGSLILGVCLSIKPLIGDYYLKAGRSSMIIGDWKGALHYFERSKRFSTYNFDIFFHLGQTYEQLKDYEKAIESYQRSISLHPFFIEAKNNLGVLYLKTGMIDEAVEEFKNAIEINPYHPNLHNNLGYLYSKIYLFNEALKEYLKAIELDPNIPELYKNIGLLYYKIGDYEKSKFYINKYLLLNPFDSEKEPLEKIIEIGE